MTAPAAGGMLIGAARIAAMVDIPGFAKSMAQTVGIAISGGKDAAKAFARGFKDEDGRNNEISLAWSRSLKDMERLAAQSGTRAADSF